MKAKKADTGKPSITMIPSGPLKDLAQVFMFGAKKYGKGNWKEGFVYSRLLDAVYRHMMAWFEGEDLDPESGLPHLSHATWGLIILRHFETNGGGFDDRKEMPGMQRNEECEQILPEPNPQAGLDMSDLLCQVEPCIQEGSTIAEIQKDITDWANRTFPDRTYQGTFNKLVFEEIPELINGGVHDPMEYADILILVLDLAYLVGVDAEKAVTKKMTINKARRWRKNPISGLFQHVRPSYTGETEEPE